MSANKVAFARTMVLVLTYLVDFSVAVKLDTRAMTVVKASDLHRTWNPKILTFSFSKTVVKRCHIVCCLVSRASKRSDLYTVPAWEAYTWTGIKIIKKLIETSCWFSSASKRHDNSNSFQYKLDGAYIRGGGRGGGEGYIFLFRLVGL